MATVNTVEIGQRLGKILEVDDLDNISLIYQHFLRFRVALDTSRPLLPGFHLPRPGKEPLWISFKYERLGDYCTLCGIIGHNKIRCSQPDYTRKIPSSSANFFTVWDAPNSITN
jgi:hypothetical protein